MPCKSSAAKEKSCYSFLTTVYYRDRLSEYIVVTGGVHEANKQN